MSVSELGKEYKNFYLNSVKESAEESTEQEMNRMSKILADYDPSGLLMN
jgi:hypothetical protein